MVSRLGVTHLTHTIVRLRAPDLAVYAVIDDRFFAAVRSRNRGGDAEEVGSCTTDEIVAVRTASPIVLFIQLAHRVIGISRRSACAIEDCKD